MMVLMSRWHCDLVCVWQGTRVVAHAGSMAGQALKACGRLPRYCIFRALWGEHPDLGPSTGRPTPGRAGPEQKCRGGPRGSHGGSGAQERLAPPCF